jgi:putative redox protein
MAQSIIHLHRLNDAFHLEATNESGNTLQMDGSPEIGGENKGMRPMQVLLAALGGCSSIDVINILKKQRQVVETYDVAVSGDRVKEGDVSIYRTIHLHFKLSGKKLNPEKVANAIKLSMEKYCSVTKTLEPTATITTSFEIIL